MWLGLHGVRIRLMGDESARETRLLIAGLDLTDEHTRLAIECILLFQIIEELLSRIVTRYLLLLGKRAWPNSWPTRLKWLFREIDQPLGKLVNRYQDFSRYDDRVKELRRLTAARNRLAHSGLISHDTGDVGAIIERQFRSLRREPLDLPQVRRSLISLRTSLENELQDVSACLSREFGGFQHGEHGLPEVDILN